MASLPGASFVRATSPAGEFILDYAHAGPEDSAVTIVSLPGSAGLEMSTAKDALARKYRVLEINPPGWGGKADLNRKMSMSEVGALLAEAVDHLVNGPHYLIGTSMGGVNALYVAASHPDRVRGIILEGSMAPARLEDLNGPPEAAGENSGAEESDYPLPPVHPKKPWATAEYIQEQMANRFSMMRWVDVEMLPEGALNAVRDAGIPVLALLGAHDEILRSSQRDAYATYLPQAQFHLIVDGHHDLQNTSADEFVSLVDDFIEGRPADD